MDKGKTKKTKKDLPIFVAVVTVAVGTSDRPMILPLPPPRREPLGRPRLAPRGG